MRLVEDIYRISYLLPVLFFFINRFGRDKAKRVIFYFCVFIIAHNFTYATLIYQNIKLADPLNLLFIPIEFLLLSFFFYNFLGYDLHKKLMLIISVVFFLVWGYYTIKSPVNLFDSVVNGIESIIIIVFSLLYFYEQLRYPKSIFIYMQPAFWGVAGFFIFACGTFFVFIYRQTSWEYDQFIYQYAYIHAISGIARNIIFTVAVSVKPYKGPIPELT